MMLTLSLPSLRPSNAIHRPSLLNASPLEENLGGSRYTTVLFTSDRTATLTCRSGKPIDEEFVDGLRVTHRMPGNLRR